MRHVAEIAGDPVQYRRAATGGRRSKPGAWQDAKSRADAARKTGVGVGRVRPDAAVLEALLEDGEPRVGVSEPVRGAGGD